LGGCGEISNIFRQVWGLMSPPGMLEIPRLEGKQN
jgi:hypothetical protein